MRPAELHVLQGSSERAKNKLGWIPKTDFHGLVQMMVDADLERVRQEVQMRDLSQNDALPPSLR